MSNVKLDHITTSFQDTRYDKIDVDKTLTKNDPITTQDDICTRFIRKKFKCIIIFLLAMIALFEFSNNLLNKLDQNLLSQMIAKIFNSTTTTTLIPN